MRNLEGHFVQWLLVRMETDAYRASHDEVHFEDFFFLVVDHVLVIFVGEVARLEPEGHIIKKFAILILLRVEEEAEVIKDVVK